MPQDSGSARSWQSEQIVPAGRDWRLSVPADSNNVVVVTISSADQSGVRNQVVAAGCEKWPNSADTSMTVGMSTFNAGPFASPVVEPNCLDFPRWWDPPNAKAVRSDSDEYCGVRCQELAPTANSAGFSLPFRHCSFDESMVEWYASRVPPTEGTSGSTEHERDSISGRNRATECVAFQRRVR